MRKPPSEPSRIYIVCPPEDGADVFLWDEGFDCATGEDVTRLTEKPEPLPLSTDGAAIICSAALTIEMGLAPASAIETFLPSIVAPAFCQITVPKLSSGKSEPRSVDGVSSIHSAEEKDDAYATGWM